MATNPGALVPWVRTTGPSGLGLPVVRERLIPAAAVPNGNAAGGLPLQCLGAGGLACRDLGDPARQLVRVPEDVEIAAFGLGVNGRARLHVGKQERSGYEAARVSRDIGASWWREVAASQVRRSGDGFSNRLAGASG